MIRSICFARITAEQIVAGEGCARLVNEQGDGIGQAYGSFMVGLSMTGASVGYGGAPVTIVRRTGASDETIGRPGDVSGVQRIAGGHSGGRSSPRTRSPRTFGDSTVRISPDLKHSFCVVHGKLAAACTRSRE